MKYDFVGVPWWKEFLQLRDSARSVPYDIRSLGSAAHERVGVISYGPYSFDESEIETLTEYLLTPLAFLSAINLSLSPVV